MSHMPRSPGFFVCFCVHDTVATCGCLNMYIDSSRSLLNISVIGHGHRGFCAFSSA